MPRMSRWQLPACAVLLLIGGCERTFLPLPLTEDLRAQFGAIAVVVAPEPPAIDFAPPTTGALAGLGVGFLRGCWFLVEAPILGAMAAGPGSGGFGALIGAAIGATAGVVYFVPSCIGGAATAPSSRDVEYARASLEPQITAVTPEQFARRFCALARGSAARDCVFAGCVGAGPAGPTIDSRALAYDTVVELRWRSLKRGPCIGAWTVDGAFDLRIVVDCRIVRVADRAVLHELTLHRVHDRRRLTYGEWASGAAWTQGLADAIDDTCEVLVDEIFLLDRSRTEAAGFVGWTAPPGGKVAW